MSLTYMKYPAIAAIATDPITIKAIAHPAIPSVEIITLSGTLSE